MGTLIGNNKWGVLLLLGIAAAAFFVRQHSFIDEMPPSFAAPKTDIQLDTGLALMTSAERKEAKALAIKTFANPRTVTTDNLTIEVQAVNQIAGGVEIYARAWNAQGQQLGFVDGTVEIERFIFQNPPVIIPDPTGTIERTYVDHRGTSTVKYRYDPRAAITAALEHTIMVSGKPSNTIVVGKVGHTTTTVYPDANVESTSVDAYMVRNNGGGGSTEAFSTIRAGAGTGSDDTAASSIAADLFAGSGAANTYQTLYRAIYVFDTSSIPDTDSISAATISVCSRSTKVDQLGGNGAVGITDGTSASNTAIANSDFESNTSGTRNADTDIDVGSWAADSVYNDWTLNATGIANISKTGVSKFTTKLGFDIDNTTTGLTWGSSGEILARSYNADKAGTSCDPKLVVTHAAAAAPTVKPIQTVFMFD